MYFTHKELLNLPISRAAYSDRMAWLMAIMPNLAYIKFEQVDNVNLNEFINEIANLSDKALIEAKLKSFMEKRDRFDTTGRENLENALKAAEFELISVFNNNNKGTQAFLAKRDKDKIAVLAFRGTEKEDLRDIKTDLDIRFYKGKKNEKIHMGFYNAFKCVDSSIRKQLKKIDGYSLYITGHSLGGALALIATRELNTDNLAACYTFGSLKVGNSEFGDSIKPPIYRVVNALDIVPCLPNTYLTEILYLLVKGVLSLKIPLIQMIFTPLLHFIQKFRGYDHHGDMRFLTTCAQDFKGLRLISNYNEIIRSFRLLKNIFTVGKFGVGDHSIDRYCEKLEHYGLERLKAR